jgi:hypothetical protein
MVSSLFASFRYWEGVICVAAPEGFPHRCVSVAISIARDMVIFNKKTVIHVVHFVQV